MATLKGVYSALKAHGYTGKDDDAAALAAFALANEIEIKDSKGQAIDIAKLAPAPAKKAVTITDEPAPEVKAEPKVEKSVDVTEAVQKAMSAMEDKIIKGFALNRPNLAAVAVGKSGAERKYDDKIKAKKAVFKSYEDAEAFSGWFFSRVGLGLRDSQAATKSWAKFGEYATRKGFVTTTMEGGGATVPEFFDSDLQNLFLTYGVARQLCRVVRTTSDTYKRPRATGDLPVYYPGESAVATDGAASRIYDQIKGTVKKGVVMAKVSREISQDSAIDIMEDAVQSAARSIALIEDDSLFNGTGWSGSGAAPYIPGVRGITNIIGLITVSDSRSIAGGADMTAHTLTQLVAAMARANAFAGANWAFICSSEVAANVIFRLAQSQGGVTFADFMQMGPTPFCFGFPVVRTPVMNRTTVATNGTIDLMFGDVSLAATFVERQGVEIDVSDQRYWDEDNIAVRAVVRHDINVHDLGTTSAQGPLGFLHQT